MLGWQTRLVSSCVYVTTCSETTRLSPRLPQTQSSPGRLSGATEVRTLWSGMILTPASYTSSLRLHSQGQRLQYFSYIMMPVRPFHHRWPLLSQLCNENIWLQLCNVNILLCFFSSFPRPYFGSFVHIIFVFSSRQTFPRCATPVESLPTWNTPATREKESRLER